MPMPKWQDSHYRFGALYLNHSPLEIATKLVWKRPFDYLMYECS